MNNTRFAIMLGLLALIVFATMLIIRSYNPSKEFQIAEQQELTEVPTRIHMIKIEEIKVHMFMEILCVSWML